MPYTFALPESGFRIPRIIFIVVDLPEPFGPRSPSISPRRKAKVRWSTARVVPKDFAREVASSAFASPVEGVEINGGSFYDLCFSVLELSRVSGLGRRPSPSMKEGRCPAHFGSRPGGVRPVNGVRMGPDSLLV